MLAFSQPFCAPQQHTRLHPSRRALADDAERPAMSKLEEKVTEILELLQADPAYVEGLKEGLHEMTPMVPRKLWKELQELVMEREQPSALLEGKWVSMRLDGHAWGTLLHRLREDGVLGKGYSEAIAEGMRVSCRAVMDEFKMAYGYTHSDEMTLLAPPGNVASYKGRVAKWLSVSASIATAILNRHLGRMAEEKGVILSDHQSALFDCRVGLFDSELEATALLLWRAFDCGVNGAQDACYHQGMGDLDRVHFADKLRWLQENGHLPLQPHQAYGSLFAKGVGQLEGVNPAKNETVPVNRSVNVHVNDGVDGMPRSLLNFKRNGLDILPKLGDPRMALREGSWWRIIDTSQVEGSHRRKQRVRRRRRGRR